MVSAKWPMLATSAFFYCILTWLLVIELRARFTGGVPVVHWVLAVTLLVCPLMMARQVMLKLSRAGVPQATRFEVASLVVATGAITTVLALTLCI